MATILSSRQTPQNKIRSYKYKKAISVRRQKELSELQATLGVNVENLSLLDKALTHPSYTSSLSDKKILLNNQRLEFFGDAILNLIISEHLFSIYPHYNEGKLSKIRSIAVSRQFLAKIAKNLNMSKYIRLGKGEKKSGNQNLSSILGDVMEAVIAAIYIDSGFEIVKKFILLSFEKEIIAIVSKIDQLDDKSKLQELTQRDHKEVPIYKVDKTEGPGHKTCFYVSVYLKGRILGSGSGYSKKDAEIACAKNALKKNYIQQKTKKGSNKVT